MKITKLITSGSFAFPTRKRKENYKEKVVQRISSEWDINADVYYVLQKPVMGFLYHYYVGNLEKE